MGYLAESYWQEGQKKVSLLLKKTMHIKDCEELVLGCICVGDFHGRI